MQRRKFFGWLGLGWLASILPWIVTACVGQKATSSSDIAKIARTDGFTPVGTITDLKKAGFLKAEINQKPVIVVQNAEKKDALTALNPTCPHKQCKVDWTGTDKSLACPCHGAKFAADGRVLRGPAKAPLTAYMAKAEGNTVLVKVS